MSKIRPFLIIVNSLLILTQMLVFTAQAKGQEKQINPLIRCLAQEEEIIHQRKYGGPLYRLNQTLINELISWSNVHVKSRYLKKICIDNREFSPSVSFLKWVLLDGLHVFELSTAQREQQAGGVAGYQAQELRGFIERLPMIFFVYLAELQLIVENPHCFHQHIPELQYFYQRFKYLEGVVARKDLMDDRQKLRNIFQNLLRLDQIAKSCAEKKED